MTDLLTALNSLVADIEAMQDGERNTWFGSFPEAQHNREEGYTFIEWPNLAISLETAKQVIADNTPPFWHEHNPWKDKAVYVPLEELVRCAIRDSSLVSYFDALDRIKTYGPKLDAYILPAGELYNLTGGIRFGEQPSDYLSPWFDQDKLKALLTKYQETVDG